jgi:hypothetical protein
MKLMGREYGSVGPIHVLLEKMISMMVFVLLPIVM